jgi:hypothetical protein
MILMIIFGVPGPYDWLVEANVSKKRAVYIFRIEIMSWQPNKEREKLTKRGVNYGSDTSLLARLDNSCLLNALLETDNPVLKYIGGRRNA